MIEQRQRQGKALRAEPPKPPPEIEAALAKLRRLVAARDRAMAAARVASERFLAAHGEVARATRISAEQARAAEQTGHPVPPLYAHQLREAKDALSAAERERDAAGARYTATANIVRRCAEHLARIGWPVDESTGRLKSPFEV